MMRSRVTLARMLAAAMLLHCPSPWTMAVWGIGKGRTGSPSMSACSGGRGKGLDGAAHRLVGGAEDIDPVDLVVLDDRDRPADIRLGR